MQQPKLVWSAALGAGGLLYLKAWLPFTGIGIPCVIHEVTGLYCPGCGITRAALALLQFDVHQAVHWNPLLFAIGPLYAMYALTAKKQMAKTSRTIMAVMLTMTIAFGLLRNMPAFAWLAPTDIQ